MNAMQISQGKKLILNIWMPGLEKNDPACMIMRSV